MAFAADQWVQPTAEELAMTSVPGFPGVPAIYLFREEITKDDLHVVQHYVRLKVLTEKGKEYANVELNFISSVDEGVGGDDKTVGDIAGRTIHADGTIIPFTGKPYLKMIEKRRVDGELYKAQTRIFTLPDVEVGSIIEYRYATRYNDYVYESPRWYIQGPLFTRAAHFMWYPTSRELIGEDGLINAITWFKILPTGVTVERHETPGGGIKDPIRTYEVSVKDVPPEPEEEFMPPFSNFTYRVLFNFTASFSDKDYWKSAGKRWSKSANSFIGPDSALTAATQPIIAGANTPDEKLHKIYSTVMGLENTDYTRDRGVKEDKASGLGKVQTAVDVLKHGRGNSQQLTYLFIGMARAAGLKAYAMQVPNRAENLFTPQWLNTNQQFTNTIAIVSIDGKDQFFSPGERYTPFGQLQWQYTYVQGMRQTDGGTDFATTPLMQFKDTTTARVANLTMADDGNVNGTIDIAYTGATALRWRQQALRGDEESLRNDLRTSLEKMIPKTLEVKVKSIENLTDYEKPLAIKFDTRGTIGVATGKRLVLPVDLFLASDTATFPQEKRDLPVYFNYPEAIQDGLRINLPPTMRVEAAPTDSKVDMTGAGAYTMTVIPAPTNITVKRLYVFGSVMVPITMYPDLRKFYSQFQAKDQESIVLKTSATTTAINRDQPVSINGLRAQ